MTLSQSVQRRPGFAGRGGGGRSFGQPVEHAAGRWVTDRLQHLERMHYGCKW